MEQTTSVTRDKVSPPDQEQSYTVYYLDGQPGRRTKLTHPYSYDPILQFSNGLKSDTCIYSDRLRAWYTSTHLDEMKMKHFGGTREDYSFYRPTQIEAFLRELLGEPALKLTRVEEHCNVATGYPCWQFSFQR